jgi:hypothetical protein
MLPPLLEIYVVWHPDDLKGATVGAKLVDHFHGTAFTGLVGGAIEVFERSVGWLERAGSPRPIPAVAPQPQDPTPPELTVVVPVLGLALARAVEAGGPWASYVTEIAAAVGSQPESMFVVPVRLSDAPRAGALANAFADVQSARNNEFLSREVSQAIAQFVRGSGSRLKVFISHTKRAGSYRDDPARLVEQVRSAIHDTHLDDFFDAHDLQVGRDWSASLIDEAKTAALLAIRTDLYATRIWCQKEILTAKTAGMPVVILDALVDGEERGSFLMDHAPRFPIDGGNGIPRALAQLVDECLKRALWERQRQLAERVGVTEIAWWAPHAPEPVTFAQWLVDHPTIDDKAALTVLHPDPPLGEDEHAVLAQIGDISGLAGRLSFLTPRGLAGRGE